jgi:ribosomal protein S12 methylthiotransferase accessory factor
VRNGREATVNSTEDPMPNLFASAAPGLLGDHSEDSGSTDVQLLLEALDYGTVIEFPARDRTSDPETRHRASLLKAASRFVRVFQLAAPDAPA